jgi:hypothetical protein
MSENAIRASAVGVTIITEPGMYSLQSEVYHGDPCPTPSLSAGMINDLLVAPALCQHNSQRLNPEWEEPEGAERFSIGSVSHIIFLEPHLFEKQVVVVDAADWRSGSAKATRDRAKITGQTAILEKHMDRIHAARAKFMANSFTRNAFEGGKFEQSIFWKHPIYGFWCRCRPDFIADSLAHLCDYKATANANPEGFGRHAFGMGYHRRAAWYLEGTEAALGRRPDSYWFCNQETKAPFLTSVVGLDMTALEAGQSENDRAAAIFDRCLRTGEWPGYRHNNALDRDTAFQVGLPTYAYHQIDERAA